MAESYAWIAHLRDGSEVPEHEPDGTRNSFRALDGDSVRAVELVALIEGRAGAIVMVPDGAEPVLLRRKRQTIRLTDAAVGSGTLATVVGWQRGDDGSYLFVIEEDGSALLSMDFQAV